MHERAVCKQIIDICLQAKEEYHLTVIDSITLKVGIYSCIHKGQLDYLFQISKQGTDLENTLLLFEDEPYTVECLSCHHIYQPSLDHHVCDHCLSQEYKIISGYDCFVENIEGR